MSASDSSSGMTGGNHPNTVIIRGGDKDASSSSSGIWDNMSGFAATVLPSWGGACLKSCLAVTVALYVLNQKHLLPKPLSAFVSKALFWPTLPITACKRLGAWSTVVDDTVILGGAPFGFANYPEKLYTEYGVRGVVNLCEEYQGPDRQYRKLGIDHLRLPTVDHFEPQVSDLEKAVAFIQKHRDQGDKVYVHCRAGHGRSAAVVFAWLMSKDPTADLRQMNKELSLLRNVRKSLWKQRNINAFHAKLTGRDPNLNAFSDADYDDGYNEEEKTKEL